MNRRSFLLGAGLFVAAPAIIRTPGLLMPVRPLPRHIAEGARIALFDIVIAGNGYDAGGLKTIGPFRYADVYWNGEPPVGDKLPEHWDYATTITWDVQR